MTGEGIVEVTIEGGNFGEAPEVLLIRSGQSDIWCTGVRVYPSGSKMRCSFDLSKAEPGVWSVQVTNPVNPDGWDELPDAFTVIAPTPTPAPTDTPTPTPTPTRYIPRATPVPSTAIPPTAAPSQPQPQPRPTKPPVIPTISLP